MSDALVKLFVALTFFAIAIAMHDWRWRAGVLVVGVVVWTVFVQDHMSWKGKS